MKNLTPQPKRPAVEQAVARIERIVSIDQGRLNDEFIEQPSHYAWLAGYCAEARDRTRRLKNDLEMRQADLMDEARRRFKDTKVLKDVLTGWIVRQPDYQQALTRYFEAQRIEDELAGGLRALEHRRDMLVQLGAQLRHEWERDPIVRAAHER